MEVLEPSKRTIRIQREAARAATASASSGRERRTRERRLSSERRKASAARVYRSRTPNRPRAQIGRAADLVIRTWNRATFDVRQLLQCEQQRVISQPPVALRLECDVELPDERQARHRDAHSPAFVERDTEILLEVLDEETRIEIPLHHLRRQIVEDPALRRALR